MCPRIVLALLGGLWAGSALAERISGNVRDPRGSPVASARVVAVSSAGSASATTGADGAFALDVPGRPPFTIRAFQSGRAGGETRVEAVPAAAITIVLPEGVTEEIAVTASRTPRTIAGTAAPVSVVSRRELVEAPAPVLDDALRRIPGFSLFRRSGSRTANPTSQGVSLRGLGASGTSRALVLDDALPLNDPFGGWIYWGRVPELALERVEVVEGGASDLWGNAALGGVIQLVRRVGAGETAEIEAWGGSEASAEGIAHLSGAARGMRAAADAELFRTDGYVPVDPAERGPVDTRASSRHGSLDATLSADAGGGAVFVRDSRYTERRGNGTPLQVNDTQMSRESAGFDGGLGNGFASVRAYRDDEIFHQTFSSIAADRSSESLVSRQRVPSAATGGSLQWSTSAGSHSLVVGAEARVVEGTSEDTVFLPSGPLLRPSGGRQRSAAGYVEDVAALSSRWTVSAALRFDAWRNDSGTTIVGGQRVALADRSATAWSPRLSTVFAFTPEVSGTVSAYRAFRAPTLNELYRPFRLGGVQTLANGALEPERLEGVETGIRYQSRDGRLFARANLFWTNLRDAVGNVTLSTTPALITRERENIGRVRDRGIELAVDARVRPEWTLSAAYLLADSRVAAAAGNPVLAGKRVPQVPRDQVTAQVRFARPSLATVAAQARWSGPQYDDDLNVFRLGSAFALDAWISREVFGGAEVFAAGENLTNRRNDVGRTPVRTIGAPATFRAGLLLRI